MGDPEIRSDEKVLMRTQGVHVKSIPFEGILTNRRIILVDRAKNILPPKEIPLGTVRDVETGENSIHDLTLTISIIAKTGETRQMILTFSRQDGGDRTRERDEWARLISESTSASFEQVIRKVIPGADAAPRQSAPAASPAESRQKIQPYADVPLPAKKSGETTPSEVPVTAAPSPADAVFCTRCGTRVSMDSAFCNKCGAPVVVPAALRPQPPSPASPPAQARRTPAEPVPAVPADISLQQSLAWDDEHEEAPVPVPASREKSRRPEKKGFLAGILSPKKRVAAPPKAAAPAPAHPPTKKSRGSLMPGRKTLIAGVVVLVVIIALAIGAVFVYPMLTNGSSADTSGTTGSSGSSGSSVPISGPLSNTGVATITVKATTAPTIPVTGVWVRISYIGTYEGTYGMPSDLQQVPGDSNPNSGDQTFEVVNGTGIVQATIQKEDSSVKHDLVVEIYNDGKLLTSGKTSDAYGRVTVSANVSTGTAVTGNQTAASPSLSPAAKAGNTTAAVKTTTVATAAKTTVPTTTKSP
jgi:hypothetical protein